MFMVLGTVSEPRQAFAAIDAIDDGATAAAPNLQHSTQVKHRRSCSLYANSRGFGMHCLGPRTGDSRSLLQILRDVHIPACFYVAAPDGYEGASMDPADVGRHGTWYLHECLAGVRPDLSGVTGPIDVVIRVMCSSRTGKRSSR